MNKFLLILLFSPISFLFAQNDIHKVKLDINSLRIQLSFSPNESSIGIGKSQLSTNFITLPFSDGNAFSFRMVEYSIIPKGTNTDIKTYYGEKTDNPSITCRVSITKDWIVAAIFTENGVVAIEPSKDPQNLNEYDVYLQEARSFECKTEGNLGQNERLRDIEGINNYSNGTTLRTYRFATMVTDEFYIARGSTDAGVNTNVAATINTLNGIYERDLAVRFILVSPTNPSSSNVFYRNTNAINTYNQNLGYVHAQLSILFGSANFDIGHCLHSTGGGVAYLSAACNGSWKGGGWSGIDSATDMFVFAHEVGHQFNANHTFSGNGGGCTAGNLSSSTAYEPGSGNTIMSYNSICDATLNITGGKTNYLHTNSLENMINYIQIGTGSTCPVTSATGNIAPVAVAGTYGIIPKNTPFVLTGSGTDANNDALTFTWEQYNLPVSNDIGSLGNTTIGSGGYTAANSTTAPLFRTLQSTSPVRTFPSLIYILNNANDPNDNEGEDLSNVGRTLNFRLTVRDNRVGSGGVHMSSTTVTIDGNSGPFLITSQNTSTLWVVGGTANINWSVNGTNTGPINCSNVKISLSTDGGQTFPTILLASTPNDGSEAITVPNLPTTQGRIKVEAIGNVFFDISNINFTISSTCLSGDSDIVPSTSLSAAIGNVSLNLGLSGVGAIITTKSGTVANTDPATKLTAFNINTSNCINFSNSTYYDKYPFKVAIAGNYTFTKTSGQYYIIMNLYNGNHNASSPCSNWIGSNATYNGSVSVSTSLTIFLNPGSYNLVITGFDASTPTYPAAYTISMSPNVYETIPSTPYSYTYVVVKNGNILAFNATSDLTNTSIYTDGVHTIYGLSFADGTDFSSYVGGTFTAFQTALGSSICGTLSSNTKIVTIINCQQIVTLSNPADNISSGNVTKQAAASNGTITATNYVTGAGTRATYQAKNIQLNAGFKADNGTIFKAEIGGCN